MELSFFPWESAGNAQLCKQVQDAGTQFLEMPTSQTAVQKCNIPPEQQSADITRTLLVLLRDNETMLEHLRVD
ncbi:hypothetical protein BT69DRAFT_1284174 [Atractiella rhizophila]|nr:hypothetical protein BT69DRAFT_1284174 [Atractiella rhizophila]